MGEYAPGSVTIYNCPDQSTAQKIFDIIFEYQLSEDWGGGDQYTFTLGDLLGNSDMSLGDEYNIAVALQEIGVLACTQQDAKYEYDATVYYTHPELGLFNASGDQSGSIMVPADVIEKAIATAGGNRVKLVDLLHKVTGKAWSDACANPPPSPQETWTYDEEWDEELETFDDDRAVL